MHMPDNAQQGPTQVSRQDWARALQKAGAPCSTRQGLCSQRWGSSTPLPIPGSTAWQALEAALSLLGGAGLPLTPAAARAVALAGEEAAEEPSVVIGVCEVDA